MTCANVWLEGVIKGTQCFITWHHGTIVHCIDLSSIWPLLSWRNGSVCKIKNQSPWIIYIYIYIGVSSKRQHLTHWGRVTHICVRKLTIIDSDNDLSSAGRRTNHYLKQCLDVVNSTRRDILQWNLKRNSYIQENVFGCVTSKKGKTRQDMTHPKPPNGHFSNV